MTTQSRTQNAVRKIAIGAKKSHGAGGFRIEILFPGSALGHPDSGIGTIGRIDHARVQPGTLVAMHPHRDDEILTYIRSGKVTHKDTIGQTEMISATRMMLMNAGSSFQHEELVDPDGDTLTALQIFLRPSTGGLEPRVQFHDVATAVSKNTWRLLAGPDDADPLTVRSQSWVADGQFDAGRNHALPDMPDRNLTRLLYVFNGKVTVRGLALGTGDAAILSADVMHIKAEDRSDLVLFTTDEDAPAFDGGMFSGNNQAANAN
ncbi:MAG: pirin family protein [Rhodobacterales bacterium]